MVQFGGYDFCMSQGWDVEEHRQDIRKAERRMIETALRHGVRPRCEIYSPKEAGYYASLGVRDFSLNIDNFILQDYWEDEGRALRELLGSLESAK